LISTVRSLLLVCVLAAACAGASPPPLSAQERPLEIQATALPFKSDDPAAATVGQLRWRGGIAMTANSRRFGGWSDLHISDDGRELASISDEGSWLTAIIDYDAKGNLAGLSQAKIGPLRALDGQPLADKAQSDAEGMARLPDGSWLVSFERNHRIWRYPELDGKPVAFATPPEIRKQPNNGGIETLTALSDGRVIAISEQYSVQSGTVRGWLGTPAAGGQYNWATFDYATRPDFSPTAIARLPDGAFATIERAYDLRHGVRCRVMRFEAADLRPGATIHAKELAFLAAPYAVDNLEGLAATKGTRGETLLWLISDDNFNPLQKNVLLQFELVPAP
jgi:hypothetical protein